MWPPKHVEYFLYYFFLTIKMILDPLFLALFFIVLLFELLLGALRRKPGCSETSPELLSLHEVFLHLITHASLEVPSTSIIMLFCSAVLDFFLGPVPAVLFRAE